MRLQLVRKKRTSSLMSYVVKIITAFGGVRPMAKALDKSVSTVQSWKARGSIPDINKPDVLSRAVAAGIDLRPEDFFPSEKTERGAA
jgi:hypothetical protein